MDNSAKETHTKKTWTGLLYSIFGTTLPFFLSLIGIVMVKKYDQIVSFIDDGQFLLFSAGLLTSSYYIFRDDDNKVALKKAGLKFGASVNHLTIIFLLVASVIYAILYFIDISRVLVNTNIWFIRISSTLIFLFSLYASYCSIYIDFLKIYQVVDVKKESVQGVEDLMKELE